ncbi:hypothetical protein DESC_120126 [Desulfosarcina cetonica]|nr:hypothetical protein DESC_120126 [Desulfosarcina cetonica]
MPKPAWWNRYIGKHDLMEENKFITSRIVMDAPPFPFEWEEKPVNVEMNQEMKPSPLSAYRF